VWGEVDQNGKPLATYMKPLATRPCNRDDFSYDSDGSSGSGKLFPPAKEYQNDVNRFKDKLRCIDEQYDIQGNYNTAKARQLVLTFEVCRDPVDAPTKFCHDYATVIEPWL